MKYILLLFIPIAISGCFFRKTNSNDIIKSPEAREKFKEGQTASNIGWKGWDKAKTLLNEADSIEPNNPLILSERGSLRLMAKTDVDGGINDCSRAYELAKSPYLKEAFANNLGLAYMSISDIESACKAWKEAGKQGEYYISEYGGFLNNPIKEANTDEKLKLKLTLLDSVAFITSRLNPPQMSRCKAAVEIANIGYDKIVVPGGSFDYGLVQDSVFLFLEAKDSDGKQIRFFTESEYSFYSPNQDKVILKGSNILNDLDLTFVQQFWKIGNYQVRVGLQNITGKAGFEGVYFSNWTDLKIEFDIYVEEYEDYPTE